MARGISEELKSDIVGAMAAGVIERLSEESRKEVLAEALKQALRSWEVEKAVNEAVEEIASHEMSAYLKQPEVVERIRSESVAAVERVLVQLPLALVDILLQGLMGRSQYDRKETDFGRALRRCLNIPEDKKR